MRSISARLLSLSCRLDRIYSARASRHVTKMAMTANTAPTQPPRPGCFSVHSSTSWMKEDILHSGRGQLSRVAWIRCAWGGRPPTIGEPRRHAHVADLVALHAVSPATFTSTTSCRGRNGGATLPIVYLCVPCHR